MQKRTKRRGKKEAKEVAITGSNKERRETGGEGMNEKHGNKE
jgi:hypothetical protein